MHNAEKQDFGWRDVVQYQVWKALDGPVTESEMNVGSSFRIAEQFFDTRLDAVCEVNPKANCFGFVPIGRSQNINVEERVKTRVSNHPAMPEYD
jgi:hypothetical protein